MVKQHGVFTNLLTYIVILLEQTKFDKAERIFDARIEIGCRERSHKMLKIANTEILYYNFAVDKFLQKV